MKSKKNKTLVLDEEQVNKYLALCSVGYERDDSVIHGNAFEAMKTVPKKSVDLLIVDPPYNLSKKFGAESFNRVSTDEYERYTRDWLSLALPLLKDDASVYVCCDWRSGMVIGNVLNDVLKVRNRITWQREKGRGCSDNWKNGMEDIWFATVSDRYKFNLDDVKIKRKVIAPYRENGKPKDWSEENGEKVRFTCPSNFWDDITVPFWSMPENTEHPTQKPEKLMAKLILASSDENDLVFDPFGGSGTTAVTAKKLGRRFVTIESDAYYCAVAVCRLEEATNDARIQGYENGVFLQRNDK